MRWLEVFLYSFVISTIVIIIFGAIDAFKVFYSGKHHEK